MTTRPGIPYVLATSKSRWSCAGTAMIAPVPYSYRTKFATQIGIGSSVKGFTAQAPVKDRKSTRLNSSHSQISYAVFCLKKKKKEEREVRHLDKIHTQTG